MCANDGLIRLNKFISWINENLCNLFYYYYPNTRCDTPKLYSLETIRDSELAESLEDRSHNIYVFSKKEKNVYTIALIPWTIESNGVYAVC
jgi:hypothetical protein